MTITLNGIYVSVVNMKRAVGFYEALLGQAVSSYDEQMSDEQMSSFDFEHFSLLLFCPDSSEEPPVFGNNTIPTFQTDSIDDTLAFIKEKNLEIVLSLQTIGPYKFVNVLVKCNFLD